jgi:hypothetical protein
MASDIAPRHGEHDDGGCRRLLDCPGGDAVAEHLDDCLERLRATAV